MSAFSEETPIDPKTYKFIKPGRPKTPIHLQKVKKLTSFSPDHYRAIHKLSCKHGCNFSTALGRILDEAVKHGIIETRANQHDKAQNTLRYASFNLIKQDGKQAQGVPPKAKRHKPA